MDSLGANISRNKKEYSGGSSKGFLTIKYGDNQKKCCLGQYLIFFNTFNLHFSNCEWESTILYFLFNVLSFYKWFLLFLKSFGCLLLLNFYKPFIIREISSYDKCCKYFSSLLLKSLWYNIPSYFLNANLLIYPFCLLNAVCWLGMNSLPFNFS